MGTRNRFIPAILLASAVSAMLWGTGGYAAYFRTNYYRHKIEARLTGFFQLPVEIGRVEPNTLNSRVFRDVSIWLPNRRDRVFFCPAATWREGGRRATPDLYLDLAGGTLTIGTEFWLPEDYRHVLRSAFTENLARVNLRQVLLRGVDLVWPKGTTRIAAQDVTGEIAFHQNHRGDATFVSRSLNGYRVSQPIHIYARVCPQEADFLPEVQLTVPKLPISVLHLDHVVGLPIRTGSFDGKITYHQFAGSEDVRLAGQADGLDLRELTQHAPFGPVAGRLTLRIEDAEVAALPHPALRSVRFNGRIEGLDFGPLAKRAGYPEIAGRADLMVYQAHIEGRRVQEFSAGGRIEAVPLDRITRRLGYGEIHGELSIRLNALRILDGQIATLDADLDATPPKGRLGTIDRKLLLETFKELVGLSVPEQLLPERIEYARMGAKVLVSDGRLRLLGLVGPNRQAMILLRLLGQEIPVPAPTETFSVQSLIDRMQASARNVDLDTLKRWWRTGPVAPPATTTRPATRAHTQPATRRATGRASSRPQRSPSFNPRTKS
jgi:hypothetical protein